MQSPNGGDANAGPIAGQMIQRGAQASKVVGNGRAKPLGSIDA